MEVIVAGRAHNESLALQTAAFAGDLVGMWQARGRAMRDADAAAAGAEGSAAIKHIVYFTNHGARAGGSLAHAHWQLVGLQVQRVGSVPV